ncbi:heat shock factor binding 1 [Fusarium acutatum]|uniref:Heat shock factor binding 1 n=1 Tax=Fusarium acutatum TaxID=78861 RepID=A0A8H4NBT9_9HYPO|nr:heat shock factor binding 1 [Fusarium acutatum]
MASNEPQPDPTANSKPENAFMDGFNSTADSFLSQPSDDARADVTAAVEELLNSLSNKFAGVSSEIFAKMDEMSRRLDNLEAALQESKAKDGGSTKSS